MRSGLNWGLFGGRDRLQVGGAQRWETFAVPVGKEGANGLLEGERPVEEGGEGGLSPGSRGDHAQNLLPLQVLLQVI